MGLSGGSARTEDFLTPLEVSTRDNLANTGGDTHPGSWPLCARPLFPWAGTACKELETERNRIECNFTYPHSSYLSFISPPSLLISCLILEQGPVFACSRLMPEATASPRSWLRFIITLLFVEPFTPRFLLNCTLCISQIGVNECLV